MLQAMAIFDGWKFLAGLGIFLFGMFMMEESIRLLAGRSFKTLIRRSTGTRLRGLVTGFISTAVLQSSSAVSLMVLAFVGAGLLTLVNAVAMLMGAMVGTTCTAWIVAIFGFKFKIDAFAMPLIGIGGLLLIVFSSSSRYVNISKLVAAFGFLFLGLDFMKTSVDGFAASFDPSSFPDFGLWVYILAGIILTAIMQSSSATIAIILTALFSGVIDFPRGTAMVIGANIGTTVTVILGAIGGIPAKKQAAVSSLIFNIGTAIVIFPVLPVFSFIINDAAGLKDNPVLAIALFHTLFNLLGVLLFAPFISTQVRFLERLFPEKRIHLTRYITNTPPEVAEAALPALCREILHQLRCSFQYILTRYRLGPRKSNLVDLAQLTGQVSISYEDITRLHADIFAFYARMQAQELDEDQATELEPVIRASRSIMNATRNLDSLVAEIDEISSDDNAFMHEARSLFKKRLSELWPVITSINYQWADRQSAKDDLDRLFDRVEEADKKFIRSCAQAVASGSIQAEKVTRLLMVNRSFTQAGRMLVLSMQALVSKSFETILAQSNTAMTGESPGLS